MRGHELVSEETYRRRRGDNTFSIPAWVWTLIISLVVNIIGAAYVTGRITEKLESVSQRVGRLESQIDRAVHP
jgi:hypothetical protein